MGRTRTTAGLQSSAQGNLSDTSHCPARDDAEGYLADAEAHTHCPASAAATLITFGEKHNHSTVIPPHFSVCSAHCGVTLSVLPSFLLSLLPIVTGNLFKSLASIFISKRTQLLPRHYFYFFYCLNYSLNC